MHNSLPQYIQKNSRGLLTFITVVPTTVHTVEHSSGYYTQEYQHQHSPEHHDLGDLVQRVVETCEISIASINSSCMIRLLVKMVYYNLMHEAGGRVL
eukprot:sb/3478975/